MNTPRERQPRLRDHAGGRGIRFERRLFQALFATADQKENCMSALSRTAQAGQFTGRWRPAPKARGEGGN